MLVLCSVSGVQSQSITVDRQMKRYDVPRVAFINKCDRMGANPYRVIEDLRTKLKHNAAAVQVPIGLEENLEGVIDLIRMKAYYHEGDDGENIIEKEIPDLLMDEVMERKQILIEALAEVDDDMGELYLMEEEPTEEQFYESIRRSTLNLSFTPVFVGSAFKNRGVQPLLNGIERYLPNPTEINNIALDRSNDEEEVPLKTDHDAPLVALAFKLEEGQFGQLTYLRVYQGVLKKRVHKL